MSVPTSPSGPRWIWSILLAGAVVLLVWGAFVLSFIAEPSAVGRTGAGVIIIGGGSIGVAILGLVAAVGLFRRARWAVSAAWVASVLMVLAVVSCWAGIVGLVGLVSSRMRPRT